jgi:PAS domain S-box-containing protein
VKRKRAEQALQDRENLLRTVINTTKEAMIAIGQDGLITIFNPAAEQMFGQKRETMIGQTLDMLMPENYRTQHAGFIRSYFSKGEPKGAIGKTMELPAIRGDHTVFSMEISLATGNYGNKRFVIAVARDITARKRAEAELRESEQNYRSIYNAANDTIFIHDIKSGEILDVNERIQDVYGYTPDEAKRLNVGAISSGEAPYTQEHALEWIVKAADGKPQLFEWLAKDKHGRLFWVEVNLKKAVIGGRDRLLAVVRDIDARKRNEETQNKLQVQIQQSQRLESIGTLAGGIAHDFNNLLMTIEGSASLMLYDIEPDHPHYDILQNIEKQVRSGAKLTAQLLGYARKGKYELKPVDLNYLVEETLETFGRTKKEIRIQPNLADDLSIIEADPGQIEQMLLNLCINASDAMPEGGELKIKTENVSHKVMKSEVFQPTPGQYVLLAITDSGIGMNQVTQERIFEPFYTTKEMGRGTGLGLASVYGVVKSHGGFIDVESKKGVGTTFRIYLPASEKEVEETPEDLPEVTEESGTILLVDDEQMVCAVGTQMLQKFGYTVLQAGSGREAIDLYQENKDDIDLVILDMIMPDLSGGKVYDRMKEINANVTVLLSSGYSIDGQASEIMERGCDGFIQKPFNMKLLSHKVLEVLHKGR